MIKPAIGARNDLVVPVGFVPDTARDDPNAKEEWIEFKDAINITVCNKRTILRYRMIEHLLKLPNIADIVNYASRGKTAWNHLKLENVKYSYIIFNECYDS